MTKQQLQFQLNSGRMSKPKIDALVNELIYYPELVETLIDEVLVEDKAGTFNASWVFDHLMRKRLVFLLPFIEKFTSSLIKLTSESCIRPMAHICEILCDAYFVKKDAVFIKSIKTPHLEQMVDACFDWLIGDHKMAAKVFSMTSLFHLGKSFDWIHPELKLVLENTIAKGSAGYKNRAAKTLLALKKLNH